MAKRANPYIEDYIPQSKIHVGLKQFNNNDDRLKKFMVCTVSNSDKKQCPCSVESESKCAYCEAPLCLICQHICMRCDHSHCTTCTLTGLEGSEVCVSCYG